MNQDKKRNDSPKALQIFEWFGGILAQSSFFRYHCQPVRWDFATNYRRYSMDAPLLIPLISTIVSLGVALFAISRGINKPVNVALAGLGLSASLHNFCQVIFWWSPSVWWTRLGYVGSIALIPVMAEFPDAVLEGRFARSRTRRLALFITAIFLAFLPTDLFFQPTLDRIGENLVAISGPMMPAYIVVMIVLLIRIAYRLVKAWRITDQEMLRRRVEFILLGEIFYVLCSTHDQLLRAQIFWIFNFPIVDLATLAFMFIVIYSTMRFRLIDVDIVISVGIYYLFLTLGTACLYFSAENLLQNYLGAYIPLSSWWATLLPAFAVALFIGPARKLIQGIIDRIFLPPPYRKMQLFQAPNFQFLVLDGRLPELEALEGELKTVMEELRKRQPAQERRR